VRRHRHDADAAELEERERDRVVAGVEVEPRLLGDEPRLVEVVVRLLDGDDVLDLGEPRHRGGLHVDHDPRRDVVVDHRPVRRGRDLLHVADDGPLRRLVVVRRDDEDPVDAEPRRLAREVHGMGGVVGAGAGDHRRAVADRLDGRPEEIELLVVGQRRRLAGRAADDETVGAVVDEERRQLAEPLDVDRPVRAEGRDCRGDDGTEHPPGFYGGAVSTCPLGERTLAQASRLLPEVVPLA
jgi:hypothetical protein